MKIEYFRYFVTIERLGSISAAAKHYCMRQNTLSTIVKQAEDEFGFQIFQRTPDGIATTALGAEFLRYAKEIDLSYSRIMSVQKNTKGITSVYIVMDPVTGPAVTMELTRCFYNSKSRGNLRFHEKSVKDTILGLGTDIEKMALIRMDEEMLDLFEKHKGKEFYAQPLLLDELCVVVPLDHPLAESDSVTPEQLQIYDVLCHQAMEDEVRRLLGKWVEKFKSFGFCTCDRHLEKALFDFGSIAIASRFSVLNDVSWGGKSIKVLKLNDTPNENRQQIVLIYSSRDMERPRYETMKGCVLKLFENIRERGGA